MANSFDVAVPNILQSLLAGETGYADARKRVTEGETKSALARLMSGGQPGADGQPDWQSAARTMAASGNLDGAVKIGTLAKTFSPETSSEIQNFRFAQTNPAFTEHQIKMKQAGRPLTNVTTNMPPQEREYDKNMGKEFSDLNIGIIKGATTARGNIASLDRLEQALQDPAVYQGAGGEKVLALKRLAKSVGMDVDGVADAELAQSITNQLALNARNPAGGAGMPGAMSDADRDYLKAMQPGVDKTPEGNRRMIDANRKINQRSLEVEKFRQDYIKKNKRIDENFYAALSDWSNANPMFAQASPATSPAASTDGWTNVSPGVRIRQK